MTRATFLTAFILALVATSAAQTPIDVVVAAVDAELQAPAKRSTLKFKFADRVDEYRIERLLPSRARVTIKTSLHTEEIFVVDGFTYSRTPAGWEKRPVGPALPPGIPSIVGLLKSRLLDVKESATRMEGTEERRVFSGSITWPQLAGVHSGRLDIEITKSTGLPAKLTFDGQCGDTRCSFEETIEYDPSITIEAPPL